MPYLQNFVLQFLSAVLIWRRYESSVVTYAEGAEIIVCYLILPPSPVLLYTRILFYEFYATEPFVQLLITLSSIRIASRSSRAV